MWLLPPLDELLPLDHPARGSLIGWAELGVEINGRWERRPTILGTPTGVRSCRKLEAACRDQTVFVADRMAPMAVLQRAQAGYEETVQATGQLQ